MADFSKSLSAALYERSRVELPHVSAELRDGSHVSGLLGIGMEPEVFWHFPYEDLDAMSLVRVHMSRSSYLAIVRGRSYQRIVERAPTGQLALPCLHLRNCMLIPVGIENGGGVTAEERQLVGCSARFVYGDNSESTTTTSFPVYSNILGVGLYGISTHRSWSRVG